MSTKRSKKRARRTRIAIIIALLVGFAAGFSLSTYLNSGEDLTQTPEFITGNPTADPAATPIAFEAESDAEEAAMTEAPAVAETAAETEADPAADPAAETAADPAAATEADPATVQEPDESEITFANMPADGEAPIEVPEMPVESVVVAAGESTAITADVDADGKGSAMGGTQTMSINVQVVKYMDPEYYQANYSTRYVLTGTEGDVGLEMTLTEGPETARPQDVFKSISLVLDDGTVVPGYQLVNQEIGADTISNPSIVNGTATQVFKRFDFTTPVKYLRISAYSGGVEKVYDFEVGDPVSPYNTLQKGDRNDAVKTMQEKLIVLGYLDDVADGAYGNNTVDAVMKAQRAMNLQQTGIADGDFQKQLFAVPNPVATEAPAATAVPAPAADNAQAPAADTAAQQPAADAATQAPTTVG